MDTIFENEVHRVEFIISPMKLLTIVEKETGMAISLTGKRIATDFRDCVKTSGLEKTIKVYIMLAEQAGAKWGQMYKKGK